MSIYAVSDLHGQYGLYQKIKDFLKPNDLVYCLGDSGDRGPEPWKTLKACLDNPQFIYIKGNHDDMLIRAFEEANSLEGTGGAQALLAYNGGADTLSGILQDPKGAEYITKLRRKYLWADRINKNGITQILTHAGFTPHPIAQSKTHLWSDEKCIAIPHTNLFIKVPREKDLLWDRYHFLEPWDNALENVDIIHGHTPIWYLQRRQGWSDDPLIGYGAYWYNPHKCCIDNCAQLTETTVLLDLDTYEEHIFSLHENPEVPIDFY